MAIRGQFSLIKRFPLPMVNRTVTTTSGLWDNEITTIGFDYQVAEECTVQPMKQKDMEVLLSGASYDNAYCIFTNSFMSSVVDGTDQLGHAIYIPDSILTPSTNGNISGAGGWFRVIKVQTWINDVINHTKVFAVRDTTLVSDDGGVIQYPQTEIDAILPLIDTKDKLRSEDWVAPWLANN